MSLPNQLVDLNPPADMLAALANPDVKAIFLAQITCGRTEPVWIDYGMDSTYYVPQGDQVVGVKLNGVALTGQADLPTVLSTPGSFFWSQGPQLLYVHLPLGQDPGARGNTVETFLQYLFADTPMDLFNLFWEPRLVDMPGLSTRIPSDFSGKAQIGGGRMTLVNTDHFFDSQFNTFGGFTVPGRLRQNWDAGQTILKMGAVGMFAGEYLTIATLSNSDFGFDDQNALMDLKEAKVQVDLPYPLNVYTQANYPAIRQQDIGRAVQMAFGRVLGVNPVCIDTANLEFQVAAHPIKSFDGAFVRDSGGLWQPIGFKSVDEMNARFTLNAADWADGKDVVVDFSGWVRDDGSLADNPSEIAVAILTDLGQPIDTDGFERARRWYDAGYIGNDPANRYTVHAPSLYLDTQNSALTTLEGMMQQVRAYLLTDNLGNFSMLPFRLYQASGLEQVLDDLELLPPGLSRNTNSGNANVKASMAVVNYAIRRDQSIQAVSTYSAPAQQYARNNPNPVIVGVGGPLNSLLDSSADSLFVNQADADYLAQALVNEYNTDPALYQGTLKWRPFAWSVGQHIHLISARHGLDVVLEIIELTLNLTARTCKVVLGNLRGFEEAAGFWVNSTDTTPLLNPLVWPAGGQVPGDESQYIRHEAGHWHDAKDNATATPLSALDHTVSRWS